MVLISIVSVKNLSTGWKSHID